MISDIHIKKTLAQFSSLKEAFIDTSSLLYMEKSSFLPLVAEEITLRVVPGVCLEYGPGYLPCIIYYNPQSTAGSTDMTIHAACLETGLPLISEDKRLLNRTARAGLPYFNSLMMLIFLVYKGAVTDDKFLFYYGRLNEIARYKNTIWEFGAAVVRDIIMNRRKK